MRDSRVSCRDKVGLWKGGKMMTAELQEGYEILGEGDRVRMREQVTNGSR
jgi:hypothetical protein